MTEKTGRVYAAVIPTLLLIPVTVLLLALKSLVFKDADWYSWILWGNAALAALNPGMLLCLIPLWRRLLGMKDAYIISGVVPAEGVKPETLNRCAAVAEARADHPIGACLRAYCGDVGAPPDKFVEMPGLGVSAQFAGQMIHAGSEEYLRGLGVEVPHAEGTVAHVALEGRALGFYRFRNQAEVTRMRKLAFRGLLLAGALKLLNWALLAFMGTDALAFVLAGEVVSFILAFYCVKQITK